MLSLVLSLTSYQRYYVLLSLYDKNFMKDLSFFLHCLCVHKALQVCWLPGLIFLAGKHSNIEIHFSMVLFVSHLGCDQFISKSCKSLISMAPTNQHADL